MATAFQRLIEALRERRRRHKHGLAASKRLGQDDAAWAELFRRDDWAPPAAGHIGRCGHCGARIDLTLVQCPQCGSEWKPNTRRSDLYRQAVVYGVALILSGYSGYAGAGWVHGHFERIQASGDFVNPEMVDTLASFTWVFCSVLMMIALTYAIERLAPIGHWRKGRAQPVEGGERRRKRGARA
jgi:hypothetical protein